MSNTAATVKLHDKWRRALEREEFKPSDKKLTANIEMRHTVISDAKVPSDKARLRYLRQQKSVLYLSLRAKMSSNGTALKNVDENKLVTEAVLLVKLFRICSEMSSILQRPVPLFRSRSTYDWDRLSMALVAISDRLTLAEQQLQIFQLSGLPIDPHSFDSQQAKPGNHIKNPREEINELVQAHQAEVTALTRENAKDKNNFSILSLNFSRLLHDMAEYIQTAKEEKITCIAVYEAEVSALHNHISRQRSLIDAMLISIQQQNNKAINSEAGPSSLEEGEAGKMNGAVRAEESSRGVAEMIATEKVVSKPEHACQMKDKDIVLRALKQEMEQKEKEWTIERQKYEEKISDMEAKIERMQIWEGGAQWDAVAKKKLKTKSREIKD